MSDAYPVVEVFGPGVNARFFSHVDKGPDHWLWTGGGTDYGIFWLPGGKLIGAHVASFLIHGGTLKPGEIVRHTCLDLHKCVYPVHLVAGTYSDNMQDAVRAGHMTGNGRIQRHRKLSIELAREIRTKYPGQSMSSLSDEYQVSMERIHSVIHNRAWKEVMPSEH